MLCHLDKEAQAEIFDCDIHKHLPASDAEINLLIISHDSVNCHTFFAHLLIVASHILFFWYSETSLLPS